MSNYTDEQIDHLVRTTSNNTFGILSLAEDVQEARRNWKAAAEQRDALAKELDELKTSSRAIALGMSRESFARFVGHVD